MQNLPDNLYSVDQIRKLEQRLFAAQVVSGYELMTRAAQAVCAYLLREYPADLQFCVYCGVGNNAGDGLVIARLLRQALRTVRVVLLQDATLFKGDALTAYQDLHASGQAVEYFTAEGDYQADVVVDALMGTGLNRPVTGLLLAAIAKINQQDSPVIAVDVPSGINADTGKASPLAVKATATLTFIGVKQGLLTGDAPEYCGKLMLETLAVPPEYFAGIPVTAEHLKFAPWPKRQRNAHKGAYGHVLIIGGAPGFSGAVLLAGSAALRSGSGLVTIATSPQHAAVLNTNRPELMCHAIAQQEQLAPLLAKATVVAIGPGLGQGEWAETLLQQVLRSAKKLVLDADALNLLARMPVPLDMPREWILTPHPGEAARLLHCSVAEVEADRFAAVRALQQQYQAVVVLKGAGSLIATEDTIALASVGNPGMASGGMGDVLTGVIAACIAQGHSLAQAAKYGVLLQGMAADQAAEAGGERGLLASDLLPMLRKLVN